MVKTVQKVGADDDDDDDDDVGEHHRNGSWWHLLLLKKEIKIAMAIAKSMIDDADDKNMESG